MSDDDSKGPVGHAVETLVYAPIGLFFEGPSLLPRLVQQGKNHARNARMFGKFAVQHGQVELRRRLAAFEQQASDMLRSFGVTGGGDGREGTVAPSPPGAGAPSSRSATGGSGASASASATAAAEPKAPAGGGDGPSLSAPTVGELAITDYDSLSASQVVTRLAGLSSDELEAVRRYEVTHRGRKTILSKVAQLQA